MSDGFCSVSCSAPGVSLRYLARALPLRGRFPLAPRRSGPPPGACHSVASAPRSLGSKRRGDSVYASIRARGAAGASREDQSQGLGFFALACALAIRPSRAPRRAPSCRCWRPLWLLQSSRPTDRASFRALAAIAQGLPLEFAHVVVGESAGKSEMLPDLR